MKNMPYSLLLRRTLTTLISAFILSCVIPVYADDNKQNKEQTPFELETFEGKPIQFNNPIPPLQKTKKIDAETLFKKVLQCHPSRSRFNVSLKLKARYGLDDDQSADISNLGKYYFGVVAEMPLLDGSDALDRQRKREYDRRKDTAKAVAKFVKAIAKRNQIERQIGLYTALEQRSQVRVKMGVTSINEQVDHLNAVIKAQEDLESIHADIIQTRLELVGQCADNKIEAMNAHLKNLAKRAGEVEE